MTKKAEWSSWTDDDTDTDPETESPRHRERGGRRGSVSTESTTREWLSVRRDLEHKLRRLLRRVERAGSPDSSGIPSRLSSEAVLELRRRAFALMDEIERRPESREEWSEQREALMTEWRVLSRRTKALVDDDPPAAVDEPLVLNEPSMRSVREPRHGPRR